MSEEKSYALEIEDLNVEYHVDGEVVHALNGISFKLAKGETIGLVGETGAGKTTTGLSILRLIPSPPGVVKGTVKVQGEDISTLSEKQMELDVRFANEQSFVYADSNQISQVLRNLIDNAIKYSPEGRTLLVSTYALRKEVYVTIRDTGVGIPAEDVPHIFDRFYKVEKAHTPSPQVGSGLGLAIVKLICDKHEAKITVKSKIGVGTTFEVVFNATY